MVLVQEDDSHDEHVIYYSSWSLTTTETKYLHVEKLALVAVQDIQRFQHYILSRKTTIISNYNPMQHILTRQFLGGKYSKWIVILQDFDLEFERTKSKKSLVFSELICDLPCSETENVIADLLPDESVFLIVPMTFGMEISSYISRPRHSSPICIALTAVKYATKPSGILSSVILFIVVGLTQILDAASHLTNMKNPSMTAILEPMVVTCLGMLLPKISYEQGIFGLLYSTIV
jgi:hypothetical protein